jgi:NAD(P)-dependent dehydrogenase (short-subunit alcohol dehydrogenase family)
MMKAGRGSIINISSHLGLTGSVKPVYAACKGGLVSFTKTLAAQYASHGIRANAIGVGTVRTERQIARYETQSFLQQQGPAARERLALQKLYPFSRGEPDQVAAIALFLASEDSHMMTGTTLAADGGRSSYLKVYVEE